jgi:hypothetical protein
MMIVLKSLIFALAMAPSIAACPNSALLLDIRDTKLVEPIYSIQFIQVVGDSLNNDSRENSITWEISDGRIVTQKCIARIGNKGASIEQYTKHHYYREDGTLLCIQESRNHQAFEVEKLYWYKNGRIDGSCYHRGNIDISGNWTDPSVVCDRDECWGHLRFQYDADGRLLNDDQGGYLVYGFNKSIIGRVSAESFRKDQLLFLDEPRASKLQNEFKHIAEHSDSVVLFSKFWRGTLTAPERKALKASSFIPVDPTQLLVNDQPIQQYLTKLGISKHHRVVLRLSDTAFLLFQLNH